jgi:hypothetical protein
MTKQPTKRPRGRPPKGKRAMSAAERKANYDARLFLLPDGVTAAEFEEWLEGTSYRAWLRRKGVESDEG